MHVRDPPTIKLRPEEKYVRSVGEKVGILATVIIIIIIIIIITIIIIIIINR